jgi:hypothetical protein
VILFGLLQFGTYMGAQQRFSDEVNFVPRSTSAKGNRIIYEHMYSRTESCNILPIDPQGCGAPTRQYAPIVWIEIIRENGRELDGQKMKRAEEFVAREFTRIALDVLASHADTVAVGWEDVPNTVCRAHQKKPSSVLAAPYFDDVEYCVSLIPSRNSSLTNHLNRREFRVRAEASVTVAKNPLSGYREPTKEEVMPYGVILVKVVNKIRDSLAEAAIQHGWQVSDDQHQVGIIGLLKK